MENTFRSFLCRFFFLCFFYNRMKRENVHLQIKLIHARNKIKAEIKKCIVFSHRELGVWALMFYFTKCKLVRFAPSKSNWWSLQLLQKNAPVHADEAHTSWFLHCNSYKVELNIYSTYTTYTVHYNQYSRLGKYCFLQFVTSDSQSVSGR